MRKHEHFPNKLEASEMLRRIQRTSWTEHVANTCPSPLWGRAPTQGTKEGDDFFLEIVSLPDYNTFLWEFIPEAVGVQPLKIQPGGPTTDQPLSMVRPPGNHSRRSGHRGTTLDGPATGEPLLTVRLPGNHAQWSGHRGTTIESVATREPCSMVWPPGNHS
ncbi:hypothetical protein LSAT2_006460 [Lamellibrachia satsuma]|nr:hypothetical protein LSAT2_006460 [Lamellibrachia satsuma]